MTQPRQSYSRDDALRELRAIARDQEQGARDLETHHSDADAILLKLIGDPEIEDAYLRIDKWYA